MIRKAVKENVGRDPDFIGIGPPKCATSWLDQVLRTHPGIFMPKDRKEVFFFTKYYNRGTDWYRGIFADAGAEQICGEISPSYIRKSGGIAIERIAQYKSDIKLVAIFRHPLDRAFSLYAMNRENAKYSYDFSEALDRHERLHEGSNYSAHLEKLMHHFDPAQLHIMIYEELFADHAETLQHLDALAQFLGVEAGQMDPMAISGPVRKMRGEPRFPRLVSCMNRVQTAMKDANMDWLIQLLRKGELDRRLLYRNTHSALKPDDQEYRQLAQRFEPDIQAVEDYLGRRIPAWHTD